MLRLSFGSLVFVALIVRAFAFSGTFTCDYAMTMTQDYEMVTSTVSALAPVQVTIPDDSHVITIVCLITSGHYLGILGSLDNGIVTDSSWRCSVDLEPDWKNPEFNDNHWALAKELGDQGSQPWGTVEGVSSSAKWIWSEANSAPLLWGSRTMNVVYCRKTLAPVLEVGDEEVQPLGVGVEEVQPLGCFYRNRTHMIDETWIEEVNADPQRQQECYCPDPLPTNWSANTGGCRAACVKEDGVVHYARERYQRTISGVLMDCKCDCRGIEKCK